MTKKQNKSEKVVEQKPPQPQQPSQITIDSILASMDEESRNNAIRALRAMKEQGEKLQAQKKETAQPKPENLLDLGKHVNEKGEAFRVIVEMDDDDIIDEDDEFCHHVKVPPKAQAPKAKEESSSDDDAIPMPVKDALKEALKEIFGRKDDSSSEDSDSDGDTETHKVSIGEAERQAIFQQLGVKNYKELKLYAQRLKFLVQQLKREGDSEATSPEEED